MKITERLEYLRAEIRAERISYAEIAELESLAQYIDANDVELLEWVMPETKFLQLHGFTSEDLHG